MRLKIPKKQAIAILEKRKSEIYRADFEPKVWKGTTESDLREIFDGMDFKWLNISQIQFETPFSDKKANVLAKGKEQAEKFMNSFIEQIEEYSKIAETKSIEREKYFESENDNLRAQISELISKVSGLIDDKNELLGELNEKDTKIEDLEKNTVQLTDITLKKIFGLIGNLPVGQTVGLFTTLLGIIGFTFYLGTLLEKNNHDSQQLDNKVKIEVLKKEKEKVEENLKNSIKSNTEKESIIDSLKIELNKKIDAEKQKTK